MLKSEAVNGLLTETFLCKMLKFVLTVASPLASHTRKM